MPNSNLAGGEKSALHTLTRLRGILGFAFPAHVLLIPDDVLAGYPQHIPRPQHNQRLFVASLLDHRDSAIEHGHAVALFQAALPLAANVVLRACLDLRGTLIGLRWSDV